MLNTPHKSPAPMPELQPDDPALAILNPIRALGLTCTFHEHDAYFTVEDGREHRAQMDGAHTKNLFLKDKKSQLVLISAHEATRVDLKSMHKRLIMSGRLSFADEGRMKALLGVSPGSVTPYGLVHDTEGAVRFILDEKLMAYERINFHPLRNTATISLLRDDFLTLMAHIGHAPRIMGLEAEDNSDALGI